MEKYIDGSIALIDFGEAFVDDDQSDSINAWSMGYAPPEVMFCGKGLRGYYSDIWSLAVTLFEIRIGDSLFGDSTMQLAVREIELFLGGLPEPYRAGRFKTLASRYGWEDDTEEIAFKLGEPVDVSAWNARPVEWEDYDSLLKGREERNIGGTDHTNILAAALGRQRRRYAPDVPGELSRIQLKYQYPREDVAQLTDLLGQMIHYDPAKRIRIDDVFDHPWIGGSERLHPIRELGKTVKVRKY